MPYRDANSVFINCPFDDQYHPVFNALVFTVSACGFVPRCAQEHDDAGEVRINKIYRIIDRCRYGIHDISRTELDAASKLPRFNMPFELGVFLGAKRFGTPKHKNKRCLILDKERHRFQQFLSDIAGQDIGAHQDDPQQAISRVRDWLRNTGAKAIPGANHIWTKYQSFCAELPVLCEQAELDSRHLIFNDYMLLVTNWLSSNI